MEKDWKILNKIPSKFISDNSDNSEVVLQLLWNRDIKEKEKIKEFLTPDFEKQVHDPFLFRDMEKAVELVIKHIKAQNKIMVYGDYDADGVTASALMVEILGILHAKVDIYIPHRVTEGYGLNMNAVDTIFETGTKLIITVDGGIRSQEEVEKIKGLGMDVVITDHHPAPDDKKDWPDCLVVNPIIEEERYPYKYLSGVGVAYKFAQAVVAKSKLNEEEKGKITRRVLDLVAIGSVADCVDLRGENRVLTKMGLEVLNQTKRPGLIELIKVAKINSPVLDSWNIGWQIAPRLNAAGRMGSANTAYELLVTKDEEEALALAERLNRRNIDRQAQTEEIFSKVEEQIDECSKDKIIIGVCPDNTSENEDDWNEGIVGLVAGRVQNKYYLPTLIITKTEDGYKGSGRSIPQFNLAAAIEKCSDYLAKYGGHPMACGFSLEKKDLEGFVELIKQIALDELGDSDLKARIEIEAEIELSQVNEEFVSEILTFAPFGQNNERPKFVSRGVRIVDIINMGLEGQHIKLRLKDDNSAVINAIGFNQSEKWQELSINDKIDIVHYLDLNEFNGKTEAQLKIVDIQSRNS